MISLAACMPTLEVSFQGKDSQPPNYISSGRRKIEKMIVRYPKEETHCLDIQPAENSRISPQPRSRCTKGFYSQGTRSKKHFLWTELCPCLKELISLKYLPNFPNFKSSQCNRRDFRLKQNVTLGIPDICVHCSYYDRHCAPGQPIESPKLAFLSNPSRTLSKTHPIASH